MKNKYLYFIAAAFLFAAAFTSCKKDKENTDDPSTVAYGIITIVTEAEGDVKMYLTGTGEATVDWGDGARETVALTHPDEMPDIFNTSNSYSYMRMHTYTVSGAKTITITGNISGLVTDRTGYVNALNLSGCPGLKFLNCSREDLTSLDVSKNIDLEYLSCGDNQLISLDVSKNIALQFLECGVNQLTSLNVSKNIALQFLDCGANQLTSLDVSKNSALKTLSCTYNQLTYLDVSKNIALKILYCSDNQLTSLDVSKNIALQFLECYNNQLSALNVRKNDALKVLMCNNNQLAALDLSNNPDLINVSCANTNLDFPALIDIFNGLPDRTGKARSSLSVSDTPGVSSGGYETAKDTAEGKNWTVYP